MTIFPEKTHPNSTKDTPPSFDDDEDNGHEQVQSKVAITQSRRRMTLGAVHPSNRSATHSTTSRKMTTNHRRVSFAAGTGVTTMEREEGNPIRPTVSSATAVQGSIPKNSILSHNISSVYSSQNKNSKKLDSIVENVTADMEKIQINHPTAPTNPNTLGRKSMTSSTTLPNDGEGGTAITVSSMNTTIPKNSQRRKSSLPFIPNGGGGSMTVGAASITAPSTLSLGNQRTGRITMQNQDRRMSLGPTSHSSSSNANSSTTRSNIHPMIESTLVTGTGAPPSMISLHDPRPIHDKTYLNSCIKTVSHYLTSHGYYLNQNMGNKSSMKDLSCPSSKEFMNMITFIVRRFDPTFLSSPSTSTTSSACKNEEEIFMIFKSLGYPYNISKTTLAAAGSPHTWPTLLLALTWLVQFFEFYDVGQGLEQEEEQMVQNKEEEQYILYTETFTMKNIEDGHQSCTEQGRDSLPLSWFNHYFSYHTTKAFHTFLHVAYPLFLLQQDEEMDQLEVSMFLESVESYNMKLEGLMENVVQINSTLLDSIQSMSQSIQDLPQERKRLQDLTHDWNKFHRLVTQYDDHKKTLSKNLDERSIELQKIHQNIQMVTDKVQTLQRTIQTQGVSVDLARTFETEQITLRKQVEHLSFLRQEHQKIAWQNELDKAKKVTDLDSIISSFKELYLRWWNQKVTLNSSSHLEEDDPVLVLLRNNDTRHNNNCMVIHPVDLSLVVKMHANRDSIHEEKQRLLLGGILDWKDISQHLLQCKGLYIDKIAQLRRDMLKYVLDQESSEERKKEFQDALDIIMGNKNRCEETMKRESEEQDKLLLVRQKDLRSTEERIRSLRDPVALESAFSSYQRQQAELMTLRQINREEHESKVKALLEEFNEAIHICAEHREYQNSMMSELKQYILSICEACDKNCVVILSADSENLLNMS